MGQKRYIETGTFSFYGQYLYDQIVPADHFLRKLLQVTDWDRYTRKLIELYKGGGEYGRPPFDPALVLKMELLAYLYDLSERQVEVFVNENLPAKFFVGLAVDQNAPDHSTLTVFRKRLIERGKLEVFGEMLREMVEDARRQGIRFGSIQIIDSVHSVANVNPDKDNKREEQGKGPRDPDARWGVKHKRKVKTEDGQKVEQPEYFYGYKTHVSLNAESGLITSLEVTSGEVYDGHHFCGLVAQDLEQHLPVETYTADKGYDDGENHFYLETHRLHSAICLKKTRLNKKDNNKQYWQGLSSKPQHQQGLKERYKIERKFGEGKQGHGLGRCRYIGLARSTVQSYLTAMVLNLKRMVKLITGIGFKTKCSLPA